MLAGQGKERKILADTFRATREMLGLPQPAFARLFEVERALVQELENGQLPAALDHRLLKFMLLNFTLQPQPQFINTLLREMNGFYGLEHIFQQPAPLVALFQQVLNTDIERWPWISESIGFRCKVVQQKRLGNALLLWASQPPSHRAAVKAIPIQTPAFLNCVAGRMIIILPAIYLFLNLDTSRSSNPIVRTMEKQFEHQETILLAMPRQLPVPIEETLDLDRLRLFSYSREKGILRESENPR